MIGERGGRDKIRTALCPICKKEIVVTHEMVRGRGYVWSKSYNTKKYFMCSWKCYRLFKYERLMEKKKLTADEVSWLRFARFPVPKEKLAKWMLEEAY